LKTNILEKLWIFQPYAIAAPLFLCHKASGVHVLSFNHINSSVHPLHFVVLSVT